MTQAGDPCFSQSINHGNRLENELETVTRGHSAVSLCLISLDLLGEAPSPSPAPELSRGSSPRRWYGTRGAAGGLGSCLRKGG